MRIEKRQFEVMLWNLAEMMIPHAVGLKRVRAQVLNVTV